MPLRLVLLLSLFGCMHKNPPVTREIRWDRPETQALARRACYDCHSNETVWPWYAAVPGVSTLVRSDVERGRAHMNFSTWDQPQDEADDAPEELAEGEMPLPLYLRFHEEAHLSPAEKRALIAGLKATLAADPPREGDDDDREDEEGENEVEEDERDDDDDDDGGHGRGRGRGRGGDDD